MDMPVGPQRKVAEEGLEARLSRRKLHCWAFWRKSEANSVGRESPGRGIAPICLGGESPPRYRGNMRDVLKHFDII